MKRKIKNILWIVLAFASLFAAANASIALGADLTITGATATLSDGTTLRLNFTATGNDSYLILAAMGRDDIRQWTMTPAGQVTPPTPPGPNPPTPPIPPVPTPGKTPVTLSIITDSSATGANQTTFDAGLADAVAATKNARIVADYRVVNEKNMPPAGLPAILSEASKIGYPAAVISSGGSVIASQALTTPADAVSLVNQYSSEPIAIKTTAKPVAKITSSTAPRGPPENAGDFWDGRQYRKLGMLPPRAGAGSRWRTFGSQGNEQVIKREDWRDVSFEAFVPGINDQNGYSSCCPNAATMALATSLNISCGLKADLSVADLYTRINGGSDSGAMLEDALSELVTTGVCSTAYAAKEGVRDRDAKRKDGYADDRKKYRILLAEWCPDVDAVGSAIQRGRPVEFGTMVGSDFEPNAEGIIGKKSGKRGGGHAMFLVGAKKINGEWYFRVVNSWGTEWGGAGKAWIHESWLMTDYFAAWAISSVVLPSDAKIVSGTIPTFRDFAIVDNRPRFFVLSSAL